MSITINCDACGKKDEQNQGFSLPKKCEPKRLWTTIFTFMDYRPCGQGQGIQKKEHHLCVECTEELLGKKLKL